MLFVEGDRIDIEIIAESGCAACHVKAACGMGDSREKVLQLVSESAKFYEPGEEMVVVIRQRSGIKAAFYAYMLPFFIILGVLFVLGGLGQSELVMGISALSSLAAYYVALRFFRKKIEKEIIFELRKTDTE